MEKCIAKLGAEMCSCVFKGSCPNAGVDIEMYLKLRKHQETLYWMLSYATLDAEPDRRLCRVCTCKKCGKFYCEGMGIPEDKAGDSFLAALYRWFYQDAYNIQYELVASKSKFNEEFLKLFDDKDKPFVEDWLKLPENQHISQMYRH